MNQTAKLSRAIWQNIVLATIFLYILFNYGFMNLRFPPVSGTGVPIGEIVLLVSLAYIRTTALSKKMNSVVPMGLLLVFWTYGFARMLEGVIETGIWAARDANQLIESLYIFVGFAIIRDERDFKKILRFTYWIILIGGAYAITFPLRNTLAALSPTVVAGAGDVIPVMFTYVGSWSLALWCGTYLFIKGQPTNLANVAVYRIMSIMMIAVTMLVYQRRTVYLQLIALLALFLFTKPILAKRMAKGLVIGALLFVGLASLGLQVTGRLGHQASLTFIGEHFLSIFGRSGGGLADPAHGIAQRLLWWTSIWNSLTESFKNMFFGLGYGIPLTKFFTPQGIPVREPHNSYISVFARTGLVGGVLWVAVQYYLIKVWRRMYRVSQKNSDRVLGNFLLLLMVYFVLNWVFALGEPAFEKPFVAIPYYFFWGVILRMGYEAGVVRRYPSMRWRIGTNMPENPLPEYASREVGS